ncbi:MAG TPA: squalene synthase HpnC [Methylocella sp.]|nr:squalene synthase HpnC [Methylocella sp.]
MTRGLPLEPTRTHRDENFPVASLLIPPRHRAVILAFYRFARGADDVADHPSLVPEAKLAALAQFEATLLGHTDVVEAAIPLRTALATRKLPPRHALDLLSAFRQDVTKSRYADWADLMNYCAYSAAPVGRFVLDVHGESESNWPASDALCSALQVINHLQDCGADYRNLDRIYIPQDALAAHNLSVQVFGADKASPALRAVLRGVVERNASLVAHGATLPGRLRNVRLRLETAVIARLAHKLNRRLLERDPLSERVHLCAVEAGLSSALGMAEGLVTLLRPNLVFSLRGDE